MPDWNTIFTHVATFFGGAGGMKLLDYLIGRRKEKDALRNLAAQRTITHEEAKENLAMTEKMFEMEHKYGKTSDDVKEAFRTITKLKKGADKDDIEELTDALVGLTNLVLYDFHEAASHLELFGDAQDLRAGLAYTVKLIQGKRHVAMMRAVGIKATFAADSMAYFDSIDIRNVWSDFEKMAALPTLQDVCNIMAPDMQRAVAIITAQELQPPSPPPSSP